eukprot:TRINITY_DN1338_c0_g1_i2.p1 TRINITY_DN1338_c0_g1~~TRINITY_DN1338_c0_g1_i2.p1  ORF type:complete len:308 (+),score=20.09 TRINITY_DN1338_c0_g1_i2:42-965(+)
MVLVYEEPIRRRYYARVLSRAFWTQFFLIAFAIIFSFAVAYTTGDFWWREGLYTEQPRITYQDKAIVVLGGQTLGSSLIWTSYDKINQLIPSNFRVPDIQASVADTNFDGLPESHTIEITMPLVSATESIFRVSALFFFDVTLQTKTRVLLQGAAYVDYSNVVPGAKLFVDGDLVLRQMTPFTPNTVRNVFATSIVNTSAIQSIEQATFQTILGAYNSRNDTTLYQQQYSTWIPGSAPTFTLSVRLRVNSWVIRYRPDFLEAVKFAWVQYVCVFLAVWFFIRPIQRFVYSEQIVPTKIVWEGKAKQM